MLDIGVVSCSARYRGERTGFFFLEQLFEDIFRRFPANGCAGNNDRHSAESVGIHLAAGEGRDDRNVFERLGPPNDVLKNGLPREPGQIQVNYALIRLRNERAAPELQEALSSRVAGTRRSRRRVPFYRE